MRRAAGAEAFRLHFQRLTLASLLASAEAEADQHASQGRHWRARRAEWEAARLRPIIQSLSAEHPRLSVADRTAGLPERIRAYTIGTPEQAPPPRRERAAATHAGSAHAARQPQQPVTASRWLLPLAITWVSCVAFLALSLLRHGIDSTQAVVADTALLPLTLALFLVYVGLGATSGPSG